jgi:putative transposase
MHDAVTAVERALGECEQLLGHRLIDDARFDPDTGVAEPVVTIVTDNGGPLRSFGFEAFIAAHPELRHIRKREGSPGQNGSRERGFGTMKYVRSTARRSTTPSLVEHIDAYRHDYNPSDLMRPIAWNRPAEVHTGLADPATPNSSKKNSCQLLDAGHDHPVGSRPSHGSRSTRRV